MLRGRAAATLAVLSFVAAAAPVVTHTGNASAAPTCTTSWLGGTGNWENGAKWSGGVPGPSDVVCITAATSNVTLSSVVNISAIVATQPLMVTAPGALLANAPQSVHSQIETLTLDRATLGGSGWVEATGVWTMRSVASMTTRWPPPQDGTAPPAGSGVTEILAGSVLQVVSVAPSPCGYGSQVVDGRTIRNDAGGTFRVAACAFFAADWGTTFDNRGTASFESDLGYYEGNLAGNPWPNTPPQFVNTGTVVKKNAGTFILAARYSGSGTIVVPSDGNITIPDHAPALAAAFRTAPKASGALGGQCDVQLCTLGVSAANPVLGVFKNAASAGAASKLVLQQNPSDRTGQTYATTSRPGGTFQWKVTKGSVAFTQSNGRATVGDPNVVTITLDKSLVKGKAASDFSVGAGGKLLELCTKPGHSMPCIASTTIAGNGFVRFIVKSLGPSGHQIKVFPLGPRIYK